MAATQGCIVADPPEYQSPVRTAPLLDVYKASPPTASIVVWTRGSPPLTFSIPVRSEDAGEDLQAWFWKDYGSPGARALNGRRIPASTYDQTNRTISYDWTPNANTDQGCHLFTFVVAHSGSFLLSESQSLDPLKAGDDAAIVNWWTNINPQNVADNTLVNCPQSDQSTAQ